MSEFSIVVEPNQSIFTSQFFTGWETYLPALGLPLPKFNNTFKDLLSYLGVISEVMSEGYVGLSTVLGDYAIPMDATNLALCQTSYWAICNRQTAEHYFPTEELTDALQQTDIQWIDVEHWRKQPDFFSIKLPKRNMFNLTIGGAKPSWRKHEPSWQRSNSLPGTTTTITNCTRTIRIYADSRHEEQLS